MGQKVSPHGLRVGIIKDWSSKWYADKSKFAENIAEDYKIRGYLKKKLYAAGISKIIIERNRTEHKDIRITILTSMRGKVVNRGEGITILVAELKKLTGKTVEIDVVDVRSSELDAQLSAEKIAEDLERRISFRRAMKQSIGRTMKSGAKGIKVLVSGRLGGAEIARSEKYSEGNVPLHTLRADIDYGFAEADTTYGKIGVKVWINHGEILDKELQSLIPQDKGERNERGDRGGKKGREGDRPRRDGDRPRRDGDRDRRKPRDGRSRDGKPELAKAVNPRVRNTPKPAPKVEEEKPVEVEAVEAVVNEETKATE